MTGKTFCGYTIYQRYKKIIDTFDSKELTLKQLQEMTKIPYSTLHRTIKDLLIHGVIIRVRYINPTHKTQVFAIQNHGKNKHV